MDASIDSICPNSISGKGDFGREEAGMKSIVVPILLAALCSSPALAFDSPTEQGNIMLMGSGNSYYSGGEWPGLAKTVITTLVVLFSDEDDDYYDRDHHRHHHYYWDDDELGISIPRAQFGLGLSYFLSSDLAVGGRYIYREDFRQSDINSLWGGGPEVLYFFGDSYHSVRPFVGAGVLFTQGIARGTRERLEAGTSLNFRGGVNIATSETLGFVVQTGYQNDHLPTLYGAPLTHKSFGIGFGFTAFVD